MAISDSVFRAGGRDEHGRFRRGVRCRRKAAAVLRRRSGDPIRRPANWTKSKCHPSTAHRGEPETAHPSSTAPELFTRLVCLLAPNHKNDRNRRSQASRILSWHPLCEFPGCEPAAFYVSDNLAGKKLGERTAIMTTSSPRTFCRQECCYGAERTKRR